VLVVFGWPAGLLCFFLFLFLYIYIYNFFFFLREFVLWFLVVDRKRETEEKIEEK
jgi:hypothetical protein